MVAIVETISQSISSALETEANRFEKIRRAAAERRRKSDMDGTRRRERQIVENNRLL